MAGDRPLDWGNQAHTELATRLPPLLSSFHTSRASVSLQLCGFFVYLKACVVPSAPGRPSEGRLQTGHQVCMSHRATRVTKCVDEYRYVCVVIFYFLLFALKSHFPMHDPSSKSILWYKNLPSSDPLHQNKPAPLPSSPSKSAPMSCSGAGRQRPCPLKTLHHNPPSAPSLSTLWGGCSGFLGCYYWDASCSTYDPSVQTCSVSQASA